MSKFTKYLTLKNKWINPLFNVSKLLGGIPRYIDFIKDWRKYSKMEGAEPIHLMDSYPRIFDKTKTTGFDSHYFYQDIWAFKKIYESKVDNHIDVGSLVDYVGFLSAITNVIFIDIRLLEVNLKNFESKEGSILSMPFENNSVNSLSCLHVAEHIGLGRYGDPLDPFGTVKSAKELSRVLALNGNLYFSVPVGKPRLCFNAHRIHSPKTIIEYFKDLKLVELSGITDSGKFIENIDIDILENSKYACGLFWFKRQG